ncbi:hypothetical protein B4U80_02436 [Leptotrombidium deliense]|uniref:Uncharacterized protein n=1 Tax=Leptotrombidium deliense TaxID=299467 RepID=A0A443SG26_9ACAR|nr:hypothetical protein B4U80_02436 [Leptotrombidium deliense]
MQWPDEKPDATSMAEAVHNWIKSKNPFIVHREYFPKCPFVLGQCADKNVPKGNDPFPIKNYAKCKIYKRYVIDLTNANHLRTVHYMRIR